MPLSGSIRIATRSSPMALAQAERVRAGLHRSSPGIATELVPVTTSGDRWKGDLARLGGKGAFTREVGAVLLAGGAELAIHCMKDVPGDQPLPAGTRFAAFPRRVVFRCVVQRTMVWISSTVMS